MSKIDKYKRSYLPKLRRLMKELEDAIIDRDEGVDSKAILKIRKILIKIERSKFINN